MRVPMLTVLIGELDLCQVDVGRGADVPEKRMSRICRGLSEPKPDERKNIARVLHLPEDDLFVESPQVSAVIAALVAKRAANIAREASLAQETGDMRVARELG